MLTTTGGRPLGAQRARKTKAAKQQSDLKFSFAKLKPYGPAVTLRKIFH